MANANFAVDTAANWASNNRTPLLDEVCFETDTRKQKVGDGSTAYNSLPYYNSNPVFGDGSDGAVTISVNTTLARDMYYTNLTVNSGIVLNPGGYRIFVTGILTNNGTIANNGTDSTSSIAGGGAPCVTWGKNPLTSSNGVNSGTGAGAAAPAAQPTSLGGAGGTGGTGAGGAGGAGGTPTVPNIGQAAFTALCRAMPTLLNGTFAYFFSSSLTSGSVTAGGEGGGAGGGSGTAAGRGGGGAGGIVAIFARTIAGTGAIQGRGGGGTASTNPNTGGSGGGGGGVVVVVSSSVVAGAVAGQTIDANGGTGGTGNGTGTNGANGSAGTVFLVPG